MSDVYKPLGGYSGPQIEDTEKRRAPSRDVGSPDDWTLEGLKNSKFPEEMFAFLEDHLASIERYRGAPSGEMTGDLWVGERQVRESNEEEGAVEREIMGRETVEQFVQGVFGAQFRRAFRNKFGRDLDDEEYSMMLDKIRTKAKRLMEPGSEWEQFDLPETSEGRA